MKYFWLAIFWVAWCVLHSALISPGITKTLQTRFPNGFRYYRIAYNLLAIATLIPVWQYGASLKGDPVVTWEGMWQMVPAVLGLAGLFFFMAGLRRYDISQFFGIRQLKGENSCSVLTDDCTLDTGGVLSIVRHPWYSAGILIVWARPLNPAVILTNLIVCGYFIIGAMLEERKLVMLFGQEYKNYQQHVSMIFPFKWACGRFAQILNRKI
jgi:protein-S-isoprenylcysteine O-methyltransferase Ste14